MTSLHPPAQSLGLYDMLLTCLVLAEQWVEWGIVEHRFATEHPDLYGLLYDAHGHVTQGPRRYTVSSYLARRMGFLAAKGEVLSRVRRGGRVVPGQRGRVGKCFPYIGR